MQNHRNRPSRLECLPQSWLSAVSDQEYCLYSHVHCCSSKFGEQSFCALQNSVSLNEEFWNPRRIYSQETTVIWSDCVAYNIYKLERLSLHNQLISFAWSSSYSIINLSSCTQSSTVVKLQAFFNLFRNKSWANRFICEIISWSECLALLSINNISELKSSAILAAVAFFEKSDYGVLISDAHELAAGLHWFNKHILRNKANPTQTRQPLNLIVV